MARNIEVIKSVWRRIKKPGRTTLGKLPYKAVAGWDMKKGKAIPGMMTPSEWGNIRTYELSALLDELIRM